MINEEAIGILRFMRNGFLEDVSAAENSASGYSDEQIIDAIDCAIKALGKPYQHDFHDMAYDPLERSVL